MIPNMQQPLGTTISPLITNIISTLTSLAILDGSDGILFLLAIPPGYYASTDTSKLHGTATSALMLIAIVVLVSFAFTFSNGYLNQYPVETETLSSFACDTSIRNAKFDTNLLPLSIPPSISTLAERFTFQYYPPLYVWIPSMELYQPR
ncbi:unnamed protein product [Adineta ricciae]|uniref:Uncharacterized protein n=1 Tax=Adineta ricciae TaxID=249248 RepID=A0A815IUK5_ADIRI|nr:unnamed protein product [Adineta ricciae]CAF1499117.1 unnamed protein product [Adineta ricciae]